MQKNAQIIRLILQEIMILSQRAITKWLPALLRFRPDPKDRNQECRTYNNATPTK